MDPQAHQYILQNFALLRCLDSASASGRCSCKWLENDSSWSYIRGVFLLWRLVPLPSTTLFCFNCFFFTLPWLLISCLDLSLSLSMFSLSLVFSFSFFYIFLFYLFTFLSFSLSLSLFLCYVLYLSVFFLFYISFSFFLVLSFWFFLFICVFLSFFLSFCLSLVLSSLSLFTSFRFPLSFLMLLSSFLVCLPRSFSFSFSSFLPSFLPVFLSVFLSLSLSHCYILR